MNIDFKKIADSFVTKTSALCFAILGLTLGAVAFMKYKKVDNEVVVAPAPQDARDPLEVEREQRLQKALSLVESKIYKKAIDPLEKLSLELPRNAHVFSALSLSQKKTGQFDKAIENLEKAIALEPGQWTLYQNMGVLQFEKGKAPEALKNFDKALELAPGTPQVLLSRAKVLETTGRFLEAKMAYLKALDTKKVDPDLTGVIQERLKKIDVLAYIEKGEP